MWGYGVDGGEKKEWAEKVVMGKTTRFRGLVRVLWGISWLIYLWFVISDHGEELDKTLNRGNKNVKPAWCGLR